MKKQVDAKSRTNSRDTISPGGPGHPCFADTHGNCAGEIFLYVKVRGDARGQASSNPL